MKLIKLTILILSLQLLHTDALFRSFFKLYKHLNKKKTFKYCENETYESCETFTDAILPEIKRGYCVAKADADCEAFSHGMRTCEIEWKKFIKNDNRCEYIKKIADCYLTSYLSVYTSVRVKLTCKNGEGYVHASAKGLACAVARDYKRRLGHKSLIDPDDMAQAMVESTDDAMCCVKTSGHGSCMATASSKKSNALINLGNLFKIDFHCGPPKNPL